MKNILKNILKVAVVFLAITTFNSCTEEETSFALNDISAPSELNANLIIANDDSKSISITPTATAASNFQVFFGDIEEEEATIISSGEMLEHTYENGEYILRVIAQGITGLTSEFSSIIIIEDQMVMTPIILVEPGIGAPTPIEAEEDVISIYSDSYSNQIVDTWKTDWSVGVFEEISIEDNLVNKYSELDFIGIETVVNQIDISTMTNIHLDIWTADAEEVRFKLVDFGADGAFDGGDDSEHEIVFNDLVSSEWNSLDISLADFTGLISNSNIAQYILSGTPSGTNTVYLDNLYFYKGAPLPTLPVNMESTELSYDWIGFGQAIPSVISNPDISGENLSSTVLEINKTEGAETWAGVILSLDGSIDFSESTTISIKFWSPKEGVTVLAKIENSDASIVAEVAAETTMVNTWETLTFDIGASTNQDFDINGEYEKIVLFADFNTSGVGDIFYADDIQLTN